MLAEALKAWSDGKGQRLALWLKESAGLTTTSVSTHLECLQHPRTWRRNQNDLRKSLDSWNAFELTQGVLTEADPR